MILSGTVGVTVNAQIVETQFWKIWKKAPFSALRTIYTPFRKLKRVTMATQSNRGWSCKIYLLFCRILFF